MIKKMIINPARIRRIDGTIFQVMSLPEKPKGESLLEDRQIDALVHRVSRSFS